MTITVHYFAECAESAERLAQHMGADAALVSVRQFPDGESLVRAVPAQGTAILYRSLDHPNAKLVELLLAASALRDGGAQRVLLVAPYLGYMRQDMAFHPGEAVSQQVIGRLIAAHFDALVTVDPHLHRTATLAEVTPGIPAIALSAAPAIAAMLRADAPADSVLVGPDSESRPWVESVADALGLPCLVGEKVRTGDRQVRIDIPDIARVSGRPVILVDDLVSSGATLLTCADLLRAAGATMVEAVCSHCLATPADLAALADGGIRRLRATDSIAGPAATAPLAPLLADALADALAHLPTNQTIL